MLGLVPVTASITYYCQERRNWGMCSRRSLGAVHTVRVQGGLGRAPGSPGTAQSRAGCQGCWMNWRPLEAAAPGPRPSLLLSPLLVPRAALRPEHIWPRAAPPRPLTGCPTAPLPPGHLVLEASCLQPRTFPSEALSREEVCSAWAQGSRSAVWHLCLGEVRKQSPHWRAGREGGRDRAPLRLTQTLQEAEKLPIRWP